MKFNFSKAFGGIRQKALPAAPIRNIAIDELSSFFGSGQASWNKESELQQYSKSLYVFAAVNRIAKKVAAVELKLYKITSKTGESDEIFEHPVLDLLTRVNPYQTRTEFLRIAWINKMLTGEAFWLKIRNEKGEVREIWNLRPDLMTVVSDEEKFIKQFELNKMDGTKVVFDPADIIFFKDPDPLNAFRGLSPISVAKTRIETEKSATEYQRDFFRNNARPDALLITEETLDTEQRSQMSSSWDEKHRGKEQNSKIGILEGGMKYQQVSISQREMDYIESSKFTRDDILVALGVPKSVMTSDGVTFNNADAGIRMFLSETINPELLQMVEVLNEFLVIPDFGEDLFLEHVDPTPEDRETRRKDNVAAYGRWMTTNEIREQYNLPDIEGGDEIAQLQGTPGGENDGAANKPANNKPQQAPSPNADGKRLRQIKGMKRLQGRPMLRFKFELMESALQSINKMKLDKKIVQKDSKNNKKKLSTNKELVSLFTQKKDREMFYDLTNKRIDRRSKDLRKAIVTEASDQKERVLAKLKKLDKSNKGVYSKINSTQVKSVLNPESEAKIWANVALPFLVDYATSGGEDAARFTGENFIFGKSLETLLTARSKFFAKSVNDTTHDKLVTTLSDGISKGEGISELTDRVNDVYDEYPVWRANMIARTETTYANNAGQLAQYKDSDIIQGKEWVATQDARTRDSHQHLDGEIVAKDEPFSNGLEYPGDDAGSAAETINCRCAMGPALFGKGDKGLGKKKVKGGPGSGNHGHRGRPGEVGGSGGARSSASISDKDRELFRAHFEAGVLSAYKSNNRELIVPEGLDRDEAIAFGAYTGVDVHVNLNASLRNGSELTERQELLTKFMDSGLSKLPSYKGKVYRGLTPPKGLSNEEFIDKTFKVGNVTKDLGYTSSSENSYSALNFTPSEGSIMLAINSKSGKEIHSLSVIRGESEILFPRGTKFSVDSVDAFPADNKASKTNYVINLTEKNSKALSKASTLFVAALQRSEKLFRKRISDPLRNIQNSGSAE